MSADQTMTLIYLSLLTGAILMFFLAQARRNINKTLQHLVLWGLIFLGTVAGVGLWGDIRHSLTPRQTLLAETGQIRLPRAPDGHYYATLEVNGHPVRFVVDTGASQVVLSRDDAASVGLHPEELEFHGIAYTANGQVRTAPVRLTSIALGPYEDRGQLAYVNDGEMKGSLLGMSYLQRFEKIEITGGALTLTR